MPITALDRGVDALQIRWENGTTSRFHYIWLRDNCPSGRHPTVGERTLDTVTIPLDLAPQEAHIGSDGKLYVIWANDGHESAYDPAWLRTHAYDADVPVAPHYYPTYWTTDRIAHRLPEAHYHAVMHDDEALLAWLCELREWGFTIVRGVPAEAETVTKLAQRVAFLRDSNFGKLFDVISMPNPNSLAYTSHKLNAHTDLVAREAQPGIQFLHCLVFDAEGGASLLVDGFAAAEELKRRHPDDWHILTTTPVTYRYQDKETDIEARFPMIRLDAEGAYFEIRYSVQLLAPLAIGYDRVLPFYRAYQNFSRILRSPEFEFKFRLQPGDCEVFNNRRVLHGRDEFNPNSGPRHLQGCYIDTDDFLSRLKVLERKGQDFRLNLGLPLR